MGSKITYIEFINRRENPPIKEGLGGLDVESIYQRNHNRSPEIEGVIKLMGNMDNEEQKRVFAMVVKKYNEVKK